MSVGSDDKEQDLQKETSASASMAGEVVARGTGLKPTEVPDIKIKMSSLGIPEDQINQAFLNKAKTINPGKPKTPVSQAKPRGSEI